MPEHLSERPGQHAFLGVLAARAVTTELARLQSDLRGIAPGFKAIPKRWLHLTLDDLGPTDPAALEAAALAGERVLKGHAPCTLRSRGWVQYGSILALAFDDPKDRLGALRAALHAGLSNYGFAVDGRRFVPHIALGRTSTEGVDLAALPAPTLSLRVERLALVQHAAPDAWGPAWQIVWSGGLSAESTASESAADDATRTDAIRAELRQRVEARAAERAALRARQARQPRTRPEPSPASSPSPRKRRRRGRKPNESRSNESKEVAASGAAQPAERRAENDSKPQRSRRRRRRRSGARPAKPRTES
jgi:2'-5' RNA ligase